MQGLQTTGLQFAEIIWFELGHIGLRGNPTLLKDICLLSNLHNPFFSSTCFVFHRAKHQLKKLESD